MGLFDLFKKTRSVNRDDDKPGLEKLLRKASIKPEFRKEFYSRLISDQLFVITPDPELKDGIQIAEKNTTIKFVSLPDGKIPVFTSVDRIFDKAVIKTTVQYLKIRGQDLFTVAKGATFILNPYSDIGKELLPDEIERMLDGTILTDSPKMETIGKQTRYQIGQPAKYPTEIVNALKLFFTDKPNINTAHLAWIFIQESGVPPHYIFALDGYGDLQTLSQEAYLIARKFLPPDEIVDFIKISADGLSEYFLDEGKPFYKK
jgi:hypothetical protein